MLTAYLSQPRWCWSRILAGLTQGECVALLATSHPIYSSLTSLTTGYIPNLSLNGWKEPGKALALVSTKKNITPHIQRMSFEFCNELENFDLTPLGAFPNLTELNLNACRNLTDSSIEIVSEQCQKLQRLELYWDVVLTDISIDALAAAAFPPLLTHLNLSGLKHITDAALVPLLRRCTALTFLDLTRCDGIRDGTMKVIGESCKKLVTLLLYATPHITDVGFEGAAAGLSHLTHLDITGMKLITDRSIEALARHCPKLKVLHLMWVTPLTDASLVAMGRAPLKELQLLSIHGNINMTPAGLEACAKGCTNIQQLDVNGVKNIGDYRMNKVALQRIFPKLNKLIFL